MGDEVERFVRGFEAFAARSGQRIVELRASGRGADVSKTVRAASRTAPPSPPSRPTPAAAARGRPPAAA